MSSDRDDPLEHTLSVSEDPEPIDPLPFSRTAHKLDETLEPDTLPTEGRLATPFDRRPSTLPPTAAGAPATPFEVPLMPRTGKRHAKVAHDLLCYAELYVARERAPERRIEIEARYQVRDARASAALDELWERRFARDPDLHEAWEITLRTLRIRDSA